MSTADERETQDPRRAPCRPCESAWGLFGVAAGLVILYIGLDLATHGALTRAISRGGDEADDDSSE